MKVPRPTTQLPNYPTKDCLPTHKKSPLEFW